MTRTSWVSADCSWIQLRASTPPASVATAFCRIAPVWAIRWKSPDCRSTSPVWPSITIWYDDMGRSATLHQSWSAVAPTVARSWTCSEPWASVFLVKTPTSPAVAHRRVEGEPGGGLDRDRLAGEASVAAGVGEAHRAGFVRNQRRGRHDVDPARGNRALGGTDESAGGVQQDVGDVAAAVGRVLHDQHRRLRARVVEARDRVGRVEEPDPVAIGAGAVRAAVGTSDADEIADGRRPARVRPDEAQGAPEILHLSVRHRGARRVEQLQARPDEVEVSGHAVDHHLVGRPGAGLDVVPV